VTSGGRALAIIAKDPGAGRETTRLAATVGPAAAARAAAAMLGDTVEAVAAVDAAPWLCFTPPAARPRMRRLAPGFGLLPQVDGDLGDRLAGCLGQLLDGGAQRVAIVGADTPHIPSGAYEAAFALLDRVDVVLGPATDGGYYLVAAGTCRPELFRGVPMGTEAVLEVTLRMAAACGLEVGLLPPLRDLDRIEDLRATLDAGELAGSPRTLAVATELLAGRMPA
jgi:rSAM/selenodomain-associated transferase 1